MEKITIHDIEGFNIGHAENRKALTGCTVILCEEGATGGVDVRGGSPGTRETDVLDPQNLVEKIHGVFLSGGSAYGLDVAGGVMKFLEEKGAGFDVTIARVPIVTGLFYLIFILEILLSGQINTWVMKRAKMPKKKKS